RSGGRRRPVRTAERIRERRVRAGGGRTAEGHCKLRGTPEVLSSLMSRAPSRRRPRRRASSLAGLGPGLGPGLGLAVALGLGGIACDRDRASRSPEGRVSDSDANRYIRRAIRSSSEGVILLPSQRAEQVYELPRLNEIAQGLRAPAARCFLMR